MSHVSILCLSIVRAIAVVAAERESARARDKIARKGQVMGREGFLYIRKD